MLPYYGLDMDMIVSVHQLVSNAIVLTGQTNEDDDDEDESAATTTETSRYLLTNKTGPRDHLGIKGKESFRWQLLAMR